MPKIHEYKDKRGFYIKANQGGRITTYQVTDQGKRWLIRNQHRPGDNISPIELQHMRESGFVFTRGSGPGEVEPIMFDDLDDVTVTTEEESVEVPPIIDIDEVPVENNDSTLSEFDLPKELPVYKIQEIPANDPDSEVEKVERPRTSRPKSMSSNC